MTVHFLHNVPRDTATRADQPFCLRCGYSKVLLAIKLLRKELCILTISLREHSGGKTFQATTAASKRHRS